MESTQEKFDGQAQRAGNRFADASSTVMDICNKQMSLVFGFYNNLFSSFPGMNKFGGMNNMNFFNPIGGAGNFGEMFPGMNLFKIQEHFAALSSERSEEMRKQMMELGSLWSEAIQKQVQSIQENRNHISKKMRELVEVNWKNRNEAVNSMLEAFNKQLDLSTELNRKFMEELNTHCTAAAKRNEQFYSDMMHKAQDHTSSQAEKDHASEPAAKKPVKPEPTHAANHKHNHNHNHHKN